MNNNENKHKQKMPIRGSIAKVLYPVFIDCAQFESDPFWKDFYLNLSKGKTVRSLSVSKKWNIKI